MSDSELPNALFLGTARAGSTWLASQLRAHPDVFVPAAKDLYFFDREYGRGEEWYRSHFREGRHSSVRIDISHDYFHSPAAAQRIRRDLPDAKLICALREPAAWIESILSNSIRNGARRGSFDRMVGDQLGVIAAGLYSRYVEMWLTATGPEQLIFYPFEDLKRDPNRLLSRLLSFLEVDPHSSALDPAQVVNAAAEPRSRLMAGLTRRAAVLVRGAGRPDLVGRVKSSPFAERLLYRESVRPFRLEEEDRHTLREFFRPDVERTETLLHLDLCNRWGYGS
ncbi:MAG: sulfotransferase [Actinomycetota bacterium]